MNKFDFHLIRENIRGGLHLGTIALIIFFVLLCVGVTNTAGEVVGTLNGRVLSVRTQSSTIETGVGGFVQGSMLVSVGGRKVQLGYSGSKRPKIGDRVKVLRHKNRFYGKSLSFGGLIEIEN